MFTDTIRYYLVEPEIDFSKKIKSYGNLPEGWNHGFGTPPDENTIEMAMEVAGYAYHNLLLIDSAPGLEGEIQIALYNIESKDQQYAEITFECDGNINITKYQKHGDSWDIVEDFDRDSVDDVKIEIDRFVRELCPNIFEYYPKNTIMSISEDMQAWRLKTFRVGYQLFRKHAYQTENLRYANI